MKSPWRRILCGLLIAFGCPAGTAAAQELQPDSVAAVQPIALPDSAALQGAVLHLAERVHDFGDIPRRGGDLACEIAFTNAGSAPLVISRVVTSSSCLKASWSRRPVAPGESGVIRIVYQPLKSEAGAFSRVIQIGSNAQTGDTQITVCGHSFDEEVPSRRFFRFGRTKLKVKHGKEKP